MKRPKNGWIAPREGGYSGSGDGKAKPPPPTGPGAASPAPCTHPVRNGTWDPHVSRCCSCKTWIDDRDEGVVTA